MIPTRSFAKVSVAFAAFLFAGSASAHLSITSGPSEGVSCAGGVCTTSALSAALNVKQLQNMLAQADVYLKSDTRSQDIVIEAPVFWTSRHRLTLDSYRSIIINRPIQVAGTGALTMKSNDGGNGGKITYDKDASITFFDLSSSLIINDSRFIQVNSIASLAKAIAQNPSGSYSLASSYNATQDGTYKTTPIPTEFDGTLDGLNHTISHFKLNSTTETVTGLIAAVGDAAAIRNLKLASISVKASGRDLMRVGGLVGITNSEDGSFSNISVSGKLSGTGPDGTGGMIGSNSFAVDQAHSSVKVAGVQAGSLIGQNDQAAVTDSSASGSVKTVASVDAHSIGGLVGINGPEGTIKRCFATGSVSGGTENSDAGGLVGVNEGEIADTYATGSVTVKLDQAGGLVGDNDKFIDTSYSTGAPKADTSYQGGFIGLDLTQGLNGTLTFDYWDLTTSGITDPSQGAGSPKNDPGITGLTDAKLKSGLPAGFDKSVWAQNAKINNGYPYLIDNQP